MILKMLFDILNFNFFLTYHSTESKLKMAELGVEAVKCTTDVEILRIRYTWVIKNVSFITIIKDRKIKSPIFTVGANKEYMWLLRLYPNGNAESSDDFVAFYLQLVSPTNKEVLAKFSFFYNHG